MMKKDVLCCVEMFYNKISIASLKLRMPININRLQLGGERVNTIIQEANRCLKCKKPQCSLNCPVSTPIPEVMQKFQEGKIDEAGRILFENNPLSPITSIVCPHERNCCGHCVLGKKGDSVEFYRVEQYISDYYLETMTVPEIKKNGKKVAVVGSGPAGLAMTFVMASHGYDVTLFEAEDDIGGVLRFGIPGFRLSKDILASYRRILDEMGVKLRLNMRMSSVIDVDDLLLDGYKAVFLGIGVGKPNKLGLLGETLGHVHYAIDYLKSPTQFVLGRQVVVVGAGNVAIDAARTAIRKNHSKVVLLNRFEEDRISADKAELELAILDGTEIINNVQVVRILEDKIVCVPVNKNIMEDGSETYVEDYSNQFEIPADSVILAIGQGPGAELSYGSVELSKRGLIEIDEFGETSKKNVWAAGDIVTGASTVVEAVAQTLKVSKNILERLEQN